MEVLQNADLKNFEVFDLAIPKALEGVESVLLNPINTWLDKNAYIATRDKLAHMFIQNFKRYEDVKEGIEFSKFGPKI